MGGAVSAAVIGSYTVIKGFRVLAGGGEDITNLSIAEGVNSPRTLLFNGPDDGVLLARSAIDIFSNIGRTVWVRSLELLKTHRGETR